MAGDDPLRIKSFKYASRKIGVSIFAPAVDDEGVQRSALGNNFEINVPWRGRY